MKLWLFILLCIQTGVSSCAAQAAGAGQAHNNLATKQSRSKALWQAIQEYDVDEVEEISRAMPLSELETFIIKYFYAPMNDLQRNAFLWLRFDKRWKESGKKNVVRLLYKEAKELAQKEMIQEPAQYDLPVAKDSLDAQLIGKSEEEQLRILDKIVRDSFTR